jgi:hypothetical protein
MAGWPHPLLGLAHDLEHADGGVLQDPIHVEGIPASAADVLAPR